MKNLETILKMQTVEEIHNFVKLQIFENTNVKTSKFNIFNYCEKKDFLRPSLNGVFHDKGQRVATDAYQIVVIKCDYPQEYEGKIIDKEGKEIDAIFPDYEAVLPKLNSELTEISLYIDEIKNQYKQFKAFKKIDKYGENPHFKFNLNDTYFNIELLFEKALPFLEYSSGKVYLTGHKKPQLYIINSNGDKYLQMPIYK
jgi:hypothetical protein